MLTEAAHEPILHHSSPKNSAKLSDLWTTTQTNFQDFTLKNVVNACKEVFP
jgi:ABC-type dipeptide/oligopeptide/nickel transport system ATPase component